MELTSDEAYEVLGGERKVEQFVAKANKLFGAWATLSIDACIDEENPEDMDFLNVQIEMKYNSCKDLSPKFMEAKEEALTEYVFNWLNASNLDMDYEAGGDGNEGPISSYRVRAVD